MKTIQQIVTDEEVERVHAYANFGSMSKRGVLADGVLKYAQGYEGGHTQFCILLEHGLIRKPIRPTHRSSLTKKGWNYLGAMLRAMQPAVIARIEDENS